MKSGGPKIFILTVLLIGAAAGFGWVIFGHFQDLTGSSKSGKASRPVPVEVAQIQRGPIALQRTFSGELEALAEFVVAPKVSGRVERVIVNIADTIKRGQVVAELDNEEYVQAVAQARADLVVARANLSQARSALEIANREFKRTESLLKRGIASDSEFDAASQDKLVKDAQLKVAAAQITKAESSLETANIRLGYTKVTAGWTGGGEHRVVAERYVDEGQTVAANTPLLLIVELHPIVGVISVTERDYAHLKPGQLVALKTEAFPDEQFTGRIERIAPVFRKSTRQARIEMIIANPQHRLKPGMFIRTTVALTQVADATLIPEQAVTIRDDRSGVFIVSEDGQSVFWREVKVGIREGHRVQIEGQGLSGRVVTLGQQLLKDGSLITIPDMQSKTADGDKKGKYPMNLPSFSVKRPIFTTMVTLIVVILGAVSLSRLQIDMLPNIELPTLSIRTDYEGASPEVMERLVTQIIEEIVATVPGVEEITSTSSEGRSRVRVSFVWGTEIDTAAIDVQGKLEDEINELPDDIVRPRIRKFDIASFPVVLLGISSNLDPVELTELIEVQIRYRFARIPGVAQVDTWGGFNREVRIELDPDRIKAAGLPLNRVLEAIRNANLDLPAGKIEQGRYEVTLRAPAEFINLDQIRDTVIDRRDGAAITLGQIAAVKDTYEKLTRIVRVNGGRGLRVAIRKQANANTVEVSKRILAEIEAVNRAFPQIKIVPVINQGNFIERSIANVARSVLYGGGLAIVVLLFFLGSIRSTLVISLSIPISIVATFALMFFGGFTLNLMTLGGLALGVGMMVDSSIVVLENIFRRRSETGEAPEQASVEGAREVGTAIIASTITTLVIFLPLIFVRGVSGILFKELAYVIIFSLICSLTVALSLVPMLASRLLRSSQQRPKGSAPRTGRWAAAAKTVFAGLENAYLDLLRWVLGHRLITVLATAVVLGASLLLLPLIGSEFLPPSDEGEVRINGKMEIGTRLELVDQQTRVMEQIVQPAVPEAVASVVSVGASGWRADAGSEGEIRMSLTPAAQRQRSNVEIAQDLRRLLDGSVPGMEIRVRAPQGQFILERILGGDEGLTIEIRGYELAILDALAGSVAKSIVDVPGITDVQTSLEAGIPQQEIRVNRDKVADLGLSVRDVTQLLQTAVAGSKAGEYRAGGNSYRILVQLKDAEKRTINEILNLTLTTASGEKVALRNVVTSAGSRGPILIDRKDQQRRVTVRANVSGRDLGSVATDVQALLNQIPRPVGYDLMVAGDFEEQQKATRELVVSLVLALVLVYMVLACQYESLRDPLVVMFSVPLAAVGVLLTLFITTTTLNVQSYIGCIMLGGIVVNNAILLVDQAGRLARGGMRTHAALTEAGRRRLRPILMTTLTTILGLLPLALGIGEGSDAQAPLARAVVGGLTGSTLITLVLIPVVYSLFHPDPKARPD